MVSGNVTEVSVVKANHKIAVAKQAVVDYFAVLCLEDQLVGLLITHQIVQQNISLANNATEALLLIILFTILDLQLCPMNIFYFVA